MPAKQRYRDSDDSDSSGGEGEGLGMSRYTALRLGWALQTWEHNARAVKELQALFAVAYAKLAVKAVQAAMYEDLLLALAQAVRMGRLGASLDRLVAAAQKVLPKQKRSALATAAKKAAVQQRRSAGRRGSDSGSEGEEAEALPSLRDLPTDVLLCVFSQLGPMELGRCACTCRSWRDLAGGANEVWRELFARTWPGRTAPVGTTDPGAGAYAQFRAAAAGRRRPLLRWAGRVLGPAGPVWLGATELRRMTPAQLAATRGIKKEQVVRWACRQAYSSSSVSEGSGSESDTSSEEGVGAVGLSRMWARGLVAT
ncbi:hypothetical protein HYH03_003284 [Edaphochlamys debaryana]|uniref:F-box domain-containing protein n=1 Tax=Edaphochlamys debaryana TaxID=47281 RepID=A0A835YDY1_9CHLO|nr:hypothetical protein HYH03_003284 [Edaphochlamys debaryana]|eukprot:KAG2499101.1 hypothetical protein HYH03_003284 [Edaphochlamys debaryana]